MSKSPDQSIGRDFYSAIHDSSGSYELVISALAAAGLGWLIDSVAGTSPIFVLVFGLAGFIGASYSMYIRYTIKMQAATGRRSEKALANSQVSSEVEAKDLTAGVSHER